MAMDIVRKIKAHFHSYQDIMLFIQIFLLITLLPLIVKHMTVSGMMKILTPKYSKRNNKYDSEHQRRRIETYTAYILSINFWMYKDICLKRSLVLYHFLRKSGLNVHVCFGVRYEEDLKDKGKLNKFEGHAWLLYNGHFFLERNPEETRTYTMTYCHPDNV
jgi:hypothetical protein